MADITDYEAEQLDRANATGTTPVVFVHGLWLLPSSWDRWRPVFEYGGLHDARARAGPTTRTRSTRRTATPRCSRTRPSGRSPTTSRTSSPSSSKKPAIIGHSFGGLLTQILAGRGLSRRVGGDRSRAVPRRAAAADLGVEVGVAGARQPGQPRPRGAAHLRAVPLRVRERGDRERGHGALQHLRGARPRARRCSRPRPPTSTRGPR